MKNLNQFGVQELNAREVKETNGGVVPEIIFGLFILSGFFWPRSRMYP